MDRFCLLRQIGRAHQVAVALAGGAATFIDGPYHKTLAAPAVPGGKHSLAVGRVLLVLGPDVAAGVDLDSEVLEERLLWAEEAHRQQHELCWVCLLGAGLLLPYFAAASS